MEKPFLHEICDRLYTAVWDTYDERTAFVSGLIGISAVVGALQIGSKYIADRIKPGFDDKVLPWIEAGCILGMFAVPAVMLVKDPEYLKGLINSCPVYASGMAGVYYGSIVTAGVDVIKKTRRYFKRNNSIPVKDIFNTLDDFHLAQLMGFDKYS